MRCTFHISSKIHDYGKENSPEKTSYNTQFSFHSMFKEELLRIFSSPFSEIATYSIIKCKNFNDRKLLAAAQAIKVLIQIFKKMMETYL